MKKIGSPLLTGLLLAVLCFNILGAAHVTATAPVGNPAPGFQEFFDAAIQQQLAGEHIAGASVAVVQNGELAFAKGYGYADQEAGTPVVADQTLFFIGSDGKLFTWTAVMQLVGQGKLDLHADVNRYLDFEIPAAFAEPITLHHLMTHTAGFEDDFNSLLLDDPDKILPLREHLVRYMPVRVYPPGKVSAYSNYGTALAGYIIERVSGQSYESYLEEHLLKPLGMNHSFVGNSVPEEFTAGLSKGYQYQNGSYLPLDFEWTSAVPCAALRTTVTDVSRFMIAHLNGGCLDGTCILPSERMDQMHSPQFTHHPQMRGMAYGFLDMDFNGQRVLWHMGESARFITLLALLPEHNLGLVVSYNTPPADGRAILLRFMDTYFPDNRPALNRQTLPGWEERARLFNGTYVPARSAHSNVQILVRNTTAVPVVIDQGQLTFSGWKYVETEPGVFQQIDGDRVLAFEQAQDGQRWLYMGPLAYFLVPWYQTPGFLFGVLGVCLLVFLSALVAALVVTLRRGRPGRFAWWLAGGFGLFNMGLLGWLASVLLTLADRYVYHSEMVTMISGLSWLAIPWAMAILGINIRTWVRGEWTLGCRLHYTLVTLAAAVFTWLLWSIHLLGGRI